MQQPFFTNAPRDVKFFGGDADTLREAQAVELRIGGDGGLADRVNHALLLCKSGIYGFPVKEEVLQFADDYPRAEFVFANRQGKIIF